MVRHEKVSSSGALPYVTTFTIHFLFFHILSTNFLRRKGEVSDLSMSSFSHEQCSALRSVRC